MVSYYQVKYQKKLMIQFWENNGRTDRQTDVSGFTGRCPIDVERPIEVN